MIKSKTYLQAYILLIFIVLFSSCDTNKIEIEIDRSYSFFIAGHTYGKPLADNLGFHPPFKNKIEEINIYPKIKFGVFTGDLVRYSTPESWDSIDSDTKRFSIPVHICPGNHDLVDRELFNSRYGDTYYYFTYHDDLFVVLDGSLNHWNIKDEQFDFFKNTFKEKAANSKNIFIFVHQLIWYSNDNIFSGINLNFPSYTPDSTNYWTDIEPLLIDLNKPVFLFAGDLGANFSTTPFMYYEDGSITYIGSGMGGEVNDNIIFINIADDKSVNFQLYALQGDPDRLGALEDFIMP